MTNVLAVIPARFASSRFPGKPLALIHGKPMIQWVYEAARSCPIITRVIAATDDQRISEVVREFGGEVEMTQSDHKSGTDRVAEVASRLDYEFVVNVQGDQPFVSRHMLELLLGPFKTGSEPQVNMTTLACPLEDRDRHDPNVVKVVCDRKDNALYFSRAPIPHCVKGSTQLARHHIGLYAFRNTFLQEFARMEPTDLEQAEQLEQLRALEHGFRVRVVPVPTFVQEVNTPDELRLAIESLGA